MAVSKENKPKPAPTRTKELSTKELIKIGLEAGKRAQAELLAANIPIVYATDNEIIREYPDGHKEVIGVSKPWVPYDGPRVIKLG